MTDNFYSRGRWDTAVARKVAVLADWWRRATGKSHFTLCRIMTFVVGVLGVVYGAQQKGAMRYVDVFFAVAWPAYLLLKIIPFWERNSVSIGDTMPIEMLSSAGLMWLLRWVTIFILAIDVLALDPVNSISSLLLILTYFMVTSFGNPPARAWYKRLADSIRTVASLRPAHVGAGA